MDKKKFEKIKNKILVGTTLSIPMLFGATSCSSEQDRGVDVYGDKIEVMSSKSADSLKAYDLKQSEIMLTAAYYGDFEGVKTAIEKGADINAQKKDDGRTSLMMLLPQISDIDMMKRYSNGKPEIPGHEKIAVINFLIDHKDIDLTIKDKAGCSILDYAEAATIRTSISKATHRERGDAVSISIKRHIEERLNNNQNPNQKTFNLTQEMGYER